MKVIFMCTANSCRSVLCEAMFNHIAPAGMQAFSTGSQPKGQIHPMSLKTLEKAGISTQGLYSKGNEALADLQPDFVITVCDNAAGEACPIYFGSAHKAHWGLADPSDCDESEAQMVAAFDATLVQIRRRLEAFMALPFAELDREQLNAQMARIGQL
ncbi:MULTISPECIES: arsenate reductase ArsC [Pseudomonas]|jgi:arsenate reductase|uniref:ArsC family transcriptional regulator n=1 Tax=Pseudomonas marincola TaxID=437900 RepID=A0A653E6I0_9PSED|nr:arsenate reductase ArsC [Pseudomonas marincola]CAE6908173.1 Arsenate reductase [Pseudomonas marincola]